MGWSRIIAGIRPSGQFWSLWRGQKTPENTTFPVPARRFLTQRETAMHTDGVADPVLGPVRHHQSCGLTVRKDGSVISSNGAPRAGAQEYLFLEGQISGSGPPFDGSGRTARSGLESSPLWTAFNGV